MDHPSIAEAELLLSKILPPKSVLALGAVMPQRLQHASKLGASSVIIVHPDETFIQQVSEAPQTQDLNLVGKSDVISPTGEDVSVFKNSIDRESGLVSAEELKPLWKNLEQISEARVSSVTWPAFAESLETKPNWLIIDRLDGLSILKGAKDHLGDVDVLYLRTKKDEDSGPLATSKEAVSVLSSCGFVLIARGLERHPALETLLFARDCAGAISRLADAEAELEAYRDGKDSDAEKRRKIAQSNLTALEQRYSDLLAKNKKTEKLVADILERLSRAESALGSDE